MVPVCVRRDVDTSTVWKKMLNQQTKNDNCAARGLLRCSTNWCWVFCSRLEEFCCIFSEKYFFKWLIAALPCYIHSQHKITCFSPQKESSTYRVAYLTSFTLVTLSRRSYVIGAVCLSVYLSVCQYVMSVCLSICQSVCLSVNMSVCHAVSMITHERIYERTSNMVDTRKGWASRSD